MSYFNRVKNLQNEMIKRARELLPVLAKKYGPFDLNVAYDDCYNFCVGEDGNIYTSDFNTFTFLEEIDLLDLALIVDTLVNIFEGKARIIDGMAEGELQHSRNVDEILQNNRR